MSLIAKNISYQIHQKKIVNNLNLTLVPGKMTIVIGANGAGKSSLLKILCDEIHNHSGQVTINDRPKNEWDVREKAKIRAVLSQENQLNFPFTVMDVVLMGRYPHVNGYESDHDYHIARSALDLVKMSHFENRNFTTLSGGEKQRVQLARVLAQIWEVSAKGPRYLFLDEPISSLDLKHQIGFLDIAKNISRQHIAVFAILHDINLAAQYADHLVIMKAGEILAQGNPIDVVNEDILEEAYDIPIVLSPHPVKNCPLVTAHEREPSLC